MSARDETHDEPGDIARLAEDVLLAMHLDGERQDARLVEKVGQFFRGEVGQDVAQGHGFAHRFLHWLGQGARRELDDAVVEDGSPADGSGVVAVLDDPNIVGVDLVLDGQDHGVEGRHEEPSFFADSLPHQIRKRVRLRPFRRERLHRLTCKTCFPSGTGTPVGTFCPRGNFWIAPLKTPSINVYSVPEAEEQLRILTRPQLNRRKGDGLSFRESKSSLEILSVVTGILLGTRPQEGNAAGDQALAIAEDRLRHVCRDAALGQEDAGDVVWVANATVIEQHAFADGPENVLFLAEVTAGQFVPPPVACNLALGTTKGRQRTEEGSVLANAHGEIPVAPWHAAAAKDQLANEIVDRLGQVDVGLGSDLLFQDLQESLVSLADFPQAA